MYILTIWCIFTSESVAQEKKKEIWLSPMTKIPKPKENSKSNGQHKNATKTSITQLLRTYLGRSVGVKTVTQLVWLNRLSGTKPSHLP